MTDRHIEKAGTRRLTDPSLDHPGRSGFRGLMTEVQRDSYRRLGWIAGVLALIGIIVLAAHFLLPAEQQEHVGIDLRARVALIGLSLIVVGTCRLRNLPPEWFPVMALLYEVSVGAILATEFLNWPALGMQGDFLLGVPRTTLWVVFFANVVPLRPREHLLGAAVATGFNIVWFLVGADAAALKMAPADAEQMWERGFEMLPGLVDGHLDRECSSLHERERKNVAESTDRLRVPPPQEKIGRPSLDRSERFFNRVDEDGNPRSHTRESSDLRPVGNPASPDSKESRLRSGERIDRVGPVAARYERQLPSGHTILPESEGPLRAGHEGWCM